MWSFDYQGARHSSTHDGVFSLESFSFANFVVVAVELANVGVTTIVTVVITFSFVRQYRCHGDGDESQKENGGECLHVELEEQMQGIEMDILGFEMTKNGRRSGVEMWNEEKNFTISRNRSLLSLSCLPFFSATWVSHILGVFPDSSRQVKQSYWSCCDGCQSLILSCIIPVSAQR